jgi:hypothetical protein
VSLQAEQLVSLVGVEQALQEGAGDCICAAIDVHVFSVLSK